MDFHIISIIKFPLLSLGGLVYSFFSISCQIITLSIINIFSSLHFHVCDWFTYLFLFCFTLLYRCISTASHIIFNPLFFFVRCCYRRIVSVWVFIFCIEVLHKPLSCKMSSLSYIHSQRGTVDAAIWANISKSTFWFSIYCIVWKHHFLIFLYV